jgi:AAHS family benzoate transporter-like MFS transporter
MKLPLQQNFIAISIPAVLGMIGVLLIDHRRSASAHRLDASDELPDVADRASAARHA